MVNHAPPLLSSYHFFDFLPMKKDGDKTVFIVMFLSSFIDCLWRREAADNSEMQLSAHQS